MRTEPTRRVVIVQRRLPHYRVPLFERMRQRAQERGLQLELVHGDPTAEEATKRDSGSIAWAHHAHHAATPWTAACAGRIPPPGPDGADLAIVTPENRLLWNLWLQFGPGRRRVGRVGLWGHGANFQGDAGSLRERFKRRSRAPHRLVVRLHEHEPARDRPQRLPARVGSPCSTTRSTPASCSAQRRRAGARGDAGAACLSSA